MDSCFTKQYGKTLINAYMGTGLQRDYVLNGMSTYIFFMSFVGDGSIVSTFFCRNNNR